jgi:protein phosphatase
VSVPIVVPHSALVILVGPAGAGKTTFAGAHFRATEVLSSDYLRAVVSDDAADMTASPQAFAVLRFIAARRLGRGRLTVVDATNVHRRDRLPLLRLAHRHSRPAIAIVFDLALETCLAQNRRRVGRQVADDVIADQWAAMPRATTELLAEGFGSVYSFKTPDSVARAIVRVAGGDPG